MTHTYHYHRVRKWLAGLAAVFALLLWPGIVQARDMEPASVDEAAIQPVAAEAPVQHFHAFLPLMTVPQMPSSFTLIDQALARGEIDEETALIYRVFVTFGDARLPQRFRGDNSGIIDSDAVAEATERFADLSPSARTILVPFLVPPIYAGSWYDLRMNGQGAAANEAATPAEDIDDRCKELAQGLFVPLVSDHFVVWYPPFDPRFAERALLISHNLETRIYPILTKMFREPLGDAGLGCNPRDGRLDIYMPHDPGKEVLLAYVSGYPKQNCKAAPTYMVVLQEHWSEVSLIAHELMHMIQRAYKPAVECYHGWWKEATANWAVDYFENVDSQADDQFEHGYAKFYLGTTLRWLADTYDRRAYGAYLWPFYLSHYTGSYHPELIAEIYAATENAANGNLYQVINSKIAGGWALRWPEFALFNLNLSPHNSYEQWDALKLRWDDWKDKQSTIWVELYGDLYASHELVEAGQMGGGYRIRDLGIAYEHLQVENAVGLLAFDNTFLGLPHVRVQALIRRTGQGWQGPEDWSNRKWTVLCQDDPAGRAEELIVIISNSNWQRIDDHDRATGPVRMVASDLSCAGWQGSSHWQIVGESSGPDSVVSYTIRGEATPTFTLSSRTLTGDALQLEYQPTAGNATWMTTYALRNLQTGQTVECTHTGGQALMPDLGALVITEDLSGEDINRRFFGSGFVPAPNRCPGLDAWTHVPWLTTDILNTGLLPWPGAQVGRLMGASNETITGEDSSHTTTSAWDFIRLNSSQ